MKDFKSFEVNHFDIDPLGEENWDDDNHNNLPYRYDTKLNITNRVINRPDYRNIFKVVVENMHGDGDAYSHTTNYYEKEIDVIKLYDFIKWANDYRRRNWRNSDKEIRRIGDMLFGEVYDILEGDATCDHQFLAKPSIKIVTYFDENGVEYIVNIKSTK